MNSHQAHLVPSICVLKPFALRKVIMPGASDAIMKCASDEEITCYYCGWNHRPGQWMEYWLRADACLCPSCNRSIWREFEDIHHERADAMTPASRKMYRAFARSHADRWRSGHRWEIQEVITPMAPRK